MTKLDRLRYIKNRVYHSRPADADKHGQMGINRKRNAQIVAQVKQRTLHVSNENFKVVVDNLVSSIRGEGHTN